jgi:hypothetical protein
MISNPAGRSSSKPPMALRYEHAEDANRSERFHQIKRDSASGFDFRYTRGDVGCQFPDIGKQIFGRFGHLESMRLSHCHRVFLKLR